MKNFILKWLPEPKHWVIAAIIAAILITFLSCGPNDNGGQIGFASSTRVVSKQAIETNYQIAVIDGCEYIYYSESHGYSGYGFMSHKGNCKNPIHQNQPVQPVLTKEEQNIELGKRIQTARLQAEIEMYKAEAEVYKAKHRLDSIKFYNR